jgi:glycosyltransferase involved in cell wall biosynthesis
VTGTADASREMRVCFAAYTFDPRKGGGSLQYFRYLPGLRKRGIADEYLRASDLYVLASDREGFPNSLLEAMASGLATVTTPFIGWGEDFGEPGRHYLLAQHDPASLASAITTILEDPALRVELATQGRAWTREFMNPDISLDRSEALYRQLGRSAAGAPALR